MGEITNHEETMGINGYKLTDETHLDWPAARAAAEQIVKHCDDAAYTAPEALASHQANIARVCVQMNIIVEALHIQTQS